MWLCFLWGGVVFVNSRILITGALDKEPTIHDDGTVDLILTNVIDEPARKDIKSNRAYKSFS